MTATERLLTARNTWTSLLVVTLKFVFGVGVFVGLVTAASVTGALLGTGTTLVRERKRPTATGP